MGHNERISSGEVNSNELTELVGRYRSVAEAHNGEYKTLLNSTSSITVRFIPAGFLEMDAPDLADDPDNLVDRVTISCSELLGLDIQIVTDYEVTLLAENVLPQMVGKDVSIYCDPVDTFYRRILGVPEPEEVQRADPWQAVDNIADAIINTMAASRTDELQVALESTNPQNQVFLPFNLYVPVINPGFLEQFKAPTEILAQAWKVAELAAEVSEQPDFTADDFQRLQIYLHSLEADGFST